MTYTLFLGNYAYSSWSLRGWLLFEKFGIPCDIQRVDLSAPSVATQLANCAPAKTVPTLRTPEGAIVSESLAIAEELASRHPNAGLWPKTPLARATARTLAAEMHAGFIALRSAFPMNLRTAFTNIAPNDDVLKDLKRLQGIWSHALAKTGSAGPWLCGEYSVADAFFAPVAARIAGYDLPVEPQAQAYVDAHLNDPAFRRWRAMGLAQGTTLPRYDQPFETQNWPGPET